MQYKTSSQACTIDGEELHIYYSKHDLKPGGNHKQPDTLEVHDQVAWVRQQNVGDPLGHIPILGLRFKLVLADTKLRLEEGS